MKVEILTFDGCPNREYAIELVDRVVAGAGVAAEVVVVDVPDPDAAERLRFLGSPTIRVEGRDIEPGADARTDFVHACRVYRTAEGVTGRPSEDWLAEALRAG